MKWLLDRRKCNFIPVKNIKTYTMKTKNTLGFAAMFTLAALFTSCDKENLAETIDSVNPDAIESMIPPQAVVVNALADNGLADLGLNINGVSVASGLDFKELTDYVGIETGQVILDIVEEDGDIVATSSYTFEEGELYNIILVVDEDGVSPSIKVLEIDPTDYVVNDSFESELGFQAGDYNLYAANVVNYMVGVEGQNVMLGLDYMGANSTSITGLLALGFEAKSGTFFGSDEVLSNIDVLVADLGVDELMTELNNQSGGVLDQLLLGDVQGISEVLTGGAAAGLLGTVSELMDGIMAETNAQMEMLSAEVMDQLNLVPGHNYTIVLTGAGQTIDAVIIDQTAAGLLEIIE
jgi:hypothetical protein